MSLLGKAVVSIWHDIAPEGREQFYAWHIHEHMSERVAIPGFLRGRRYIAEWGEPEFFNLYEAESLDVLAGPGYQNRLNNPTPWTLSTVPYFRNVARSTQQVRYSAGPGMGGYLLTLQLELAEPAVFLEQVTQKVLVPVSEIHGICGVHLCESDIAVSSKPTKEKEARKSDTSVPAWALLIEGASRAIVERARQELASDAALQQVGTGANIHAALYRFEYACMKIDSV